MATRNFTGTGNFNAAARWDTPPVAGDDININGACTLSADDAAKYGTVTILDTKSFDKGNYDFNCAALVKNQSGIYISDDSGELKADALTFTGGAASPGTVRLSIASVMRVQTLYNVGATAAIWQTSNRGILYIDGACTLSANAANNMLNKFYISTGGSIVATTSVNVRTQTSTSNTFNIDGTFEFSAATTGYFLVGSYNFIIGENGDIKLTNTTTEIDMRPPNTTNLGTCTYNRTSPLTLVENCVKVWQTLGTADNAIYAHLDLLNALATQIYIPTITGNKTYTFSTGTLKTQNFRIQAATDSVSTLTFVAATNNPSFVHSGDIDFNFNNRASFTIRYTLGTGTITLTGTSGTQTINYRTTDKIEALILNCAGATKQFLHDIATPSLTITAGTLDCSTNDVDIVVDENVAVAGNLKLADSETALSCVDFTLTGTMESGGTDSLVTLSGDLEVDNGCSGTCKYKLTGTGTIDANDHSIGTLIIPEGAAYTDVSGMVISNLDVDGPLTFKDDQEYDITSNISGSGTIASDGDLIYIPFEGDYTFDGTLDNVVFFADDSRKTRSHNEFDFSFNF